MKSFFQSIKTYFVGHKLLTSLVAILLAIGLLAGALILFLPGSDPKLTRELWAEMLGANFGYSEYYTGQPFFSDITSENPLFAAVQGLKEDGVIDYEGQFEPSKTVTFAEMLIAAVQIYGENYICNRLGQDTATAEELKDYVRSSCNLSSNYDDSDILTKEQAAAWVDELHANWLSREFGNSFTSETKENVRDKITETEYTLSGDTLTVTSPTAIAAGDVLLLGANQENPQGIARKVDAIVTQQGDTYTLTVSEPKIEEIFDRFELEFSQQMEPGTFVPAEGITVVADSEGDELLLNIDRTLLGGQGSAVPLLGGSEKGQAAVLNDFSASNTGVFFDKSITVSSGDLKRNPDFPGGDVFNGTDTLADGIFLDENNNKKSKYDAGFELECGLKLSNFKISGSLDWNGLIYFSEFNVNTYMDVTLYFQLRGNAAKSFKLGSIPCPLGFGFSARVDLYVVLSVNGEVSIEPVIHCNGTVRKASNSYLPRASGRADCTTTLSVSADVGVQVGPDVTLSFLDVADFADAYLLVGVGASAAWNNANPSALSVEVYLPTLHVGIGLNDDTLLSKLLEVFRDPQVDWAILDNNGGTWNCPVVFTAEFQIMKKNPLQWNFQDGTLTVSGTIPEYQGETVGESMPPWFTGTQVDPGTADDPNPVNVEIKKIVIAEGVTHIGSGAFSCLSGLEEVVLPETLISIGDYAFDGCEQLKTVTLPDSVVSLGTGAFYWCPALEEVTLSKNLTKISAETFRDCSSLKNITVPDSVQSIGTNAFTDCTALAEVSFGTGVTKLGREVFAGCTALKSVTLPTRLKRVPMKAFFGCSSLETVVLSANTNNLGMLAFGECRALTQVKGLDNVTWKEEGVFYNCIGLGEFNYGDQQVWEELYQNRVSDEDTAWDTVK